MGAKSWMIAYSDGPPRRILSARPQVDEAATDALVDTLFRGASRIGETDLFAINPPDNEIVAGVFPGMALLAAADFGIDYPSKLAPRFIEQAPNRMIHLHAMHSVVDWFAFGVWDQGRLVRSLSLSPDHGVMEDEGEKLSFEEPYWAGTHPAVEDDEEYAFPFHPLDLAEVVLAELFGFVLEGTPLDESVDPDDVTLLRYRRRPRW